MYFSSWPLVSSVPATSTTGSPVADKGRSETCSAGRPTVLTDMPADMVRAAASIRATATGCDQRVGSWRLDM